MRDAYPPITDDDQTIRAALEDAHVPSLVTALVHLTGDVSFLRGDIKVDTAFLGDPQGGISEEQQARVRALAFEALKAYRDGAELPPPPSRETVSEMLNFIIGQEVSENYVAFLMEELALEAEDPAHHEEREQEQRARRQDEE